MAEELIQVQACGFIIFRTNPETGIKEFLLMRHRDRYDLPKGHREKGETEMENALRELEEETGIDASDILLDPTFRFTEVYYPPYNTFGPGKVKKTLVIFMATLKNDSAAKELVMTEHEGSLWIPWNPPHQIQENTIDPLLEELGRHFNRP